MASSPTYASTPRCGSCQLLPADTTVAKAASNFAPAAAGTRVNQIRCCSGNGANPGGTTKVDVLVNDGTNDRILATFAMTNTQDTLQYDERFDNLILPTGYALKFATRTTLAASSSLDFLIMGADLT